MNRTLLKKQKMLLDGLRNASIPLFPKEKIEEILKSMPYERRTLASGNLVYYKPGIGPRLLLIAHGNVAGFQVIGHHPSGMLRLGRIGNHITDIPVGTRIRFASGIVGVLIANEKSTTLERILQADVGASTDEEAKMVAPLGTPAYFAGTPELSSDGTCLFTPYANNLFGCSMLMRVMELLQDKKCPHDIYFAFTLGGNSNISGASQTAWEIESEIAISINAKGTASEEGYANPPLLSGGPIILTRGGIFLSPCVYLKAREIAQKLRLPYQMLVGGRENDEASEAAEIKAGAVAGAICFAVGGAHSPMEAVSIRDGEYGARLLAAMLKEGLSPYEKTML